MAEDLSNKITTLTKAEYRQAATQLYNGTYPGVDFSVPFSKAKNYLGQPVFDGVEHVVINAGGGSAAVRNLKTRKAAKTRQAKARSEALLLDPAALAELDRLEEGDFFSQGRSKAGFLAKRLEDEKKFEQELKRYRQITGVELDSGHMTTRENNSPQARAAELRRINQAKGARQPIDVAEMAAAGLPLNDLDDVLSYEVGSGTNVQADFAARTAMQNTGMSGEQAMAVTDRKLQLAAQEQADKLKLMRRSATAFAAGGAATLYGGMGTAASAAEVGVRGQIAEQTGNPIDRLQQGIAGLSLGADVASYAPPLAVPASMASGALDVTNMGIDTIRGFMDEVSGLISRINKPSSRFSVPNLPNLK